MGQEHPTPVDQLESGSISFPEIVVPIAAQSCFFPVPSNFFFFIIIFVSANLETWLPNEILKLLYQLPTNETRPYLSLQPAAF